MGNETIHDRLLKINLSNFYLRKLGLPCFDRDTRKRR